MVSRTIMHDATHPPCMQARQSFIETTGLRADQNGDVQAGRQAGKQADYKLSMVLALASIQAL